jgi:hypothetical protein
LKLLTEFLKRIFRLSKNRMNPVTSKYLEAPEPIALPDVAGNFSLNWSIVRDPDSEERLSFELWLVGGGLLHKELAVFENPARAKALVDQLCGKYGNALREIRLAPGVSVYIGGSSPSKFQNFAEHVCNFKYVQEMPASKRDAATKEVFAAETVFTKQDGVDLH